MNWGIGVGASGWIVDGWGGSAVARLIHHPDRVSALVLYRVGYRKDAEYSRRHPQHGRSGLLARRRYAQMAQRDSPATGWAGRLGGQ
jgi:hypothetical protein